MSEWNLSDKIEYCEDYNLRGQDDIHPAVLADVILTKDVKEFIERLKYVLCGKDGVRSVRVFNEIDELAGEKLI